MSYMVCYALFIYVAAFIYERIKLFKLILVIILCLNAILYLALSLLSLFKILRVWNCCILFICIAFCHAMIPPAVYPIIINWQEKYDKKKFQTSKNFGCILSITFAIFLQKLIKFFFTIDFLTGDIF